MTIINMLRSGVGNGNNQNQYTHNMYPRPDLLLENMGENMGSHEVRDDAKLLLHRWNSCQCFNHGAIKRAKEAAGSATCAIEVGDEIPLVWIPNRHTLEGVTLCVNNGVKDVVVGIKRYSVAEGGLVISDATEEEVILTGSDAGPHSVPLTVAEAQAEIDALGCGERYDIKKFCSECGSPGCYYEKWYTDRILVGGCKPEGQYLSLVIEALPADFDCSASCLDISVGARVRTPGCGGE